MSEDVIPAEDKATRAAEELAAEGVSVTAAAVRERSGVRMATAAAAAKAWKEREKKAEGEVTEPVPEQLQARFLAVWNEARALSRAEFDEARAGGEMKLRASESDVAKLTSAVEELERECERFEAEARNAAQLAIDEIAAAQDSTAHQADVQASQLAAERSRADRAEGALEAVTAERDRLLVQLEKARVTAND